MTLKEPFWAWSCAVYERDGLADALIQLQDDFALDVNMLLWCAWLAAHGVDAPEFLLRQGIEATRDWSFNVVTPLRSARRAVKESRPESELYTMLKAAELRAESVAQERLEGCLKNAGLGASQPDPAPDIAARLARRNVSSYLALEGTARRKGFSVELIDVVIARIFPDHDVNRGARRSG